MNKKSIFLVSLLLFVGITAAQSNQTAQNGYSPGLIDSGSPLYGLELAADNAAVSIGMKKASSVARERVAEVESASKRNDTRGMEKASKAFENAAKKSKADEAEDISKAEAELERVIQNAPEQAQQGLSTALENVRKDREQKSQAARENREKPDQRNTDNTEPPESQSDQEEVPNPSPAPDDRETDSDTDISPETDNSTTKRSFFTGRFDLMISDRPADISKFDFVNVEFSEARIFISNEEDTSENETDTEEGSNNQTGNETKNETTNATTKSDEESDDEGYRVVQLNNSSVDLTTVVGTEAESIADVELEEGTYNKIELYSSNIDAEINGSSVEVKIPPKKLMITKPFEVSANETTQFVFDIQVVLRGNEQNNQGYILKPVISESGVAGKDVEVEEKTEDEEVEEDSQESENETEESGQPDNPGNGQGQSP